MDRRLWCRKKKELAENIGIAVIAAAAVSGTAVYVLNVVRQYGQGGRVGTDEIFAVSLFLVVILAVLARVSWNRLRGEIKRRRQTEQILRESEQKYRALVENAPVGIVISSFDGRVIDVNETLFRMHGYGSKEEFMKSCVSDRFCDPKDRDRWVGGVWDTGKVDGFEAQVKRKDGSVFWTSTTAIPRITETGEQQIVAVVEDITAHKTAAEALRSSELRYRSLFDHMLEGFAYCRMIFEDGNATDFEYLEVNDRFTELTGLHDVIGKRVTQLIPGIHESNPELIDACGKATRSMRPQKIQTYLPALDRWFSISVYNSEPEHFVSVFDAVRGRRRASAGMMWDGDKLRYD